MKIKVIAAAACITFVSIARADGYSTFKLGPDARTGALGLTGAVMPAGAASAYWNPAGLMRLRGADIQLSHHQWIVGVSSEFLSVGWGGEKSAAGLHILYTSVGDIEHRIGPSPDPLFTFSSYEVIAGFTYARNIASGLSVGATLKLFYEKIYIHEALGIGGDIGIQYRVWEKGFLLGGSVQNIGSGGKMEDERVSLPLTVRLGGMMPFNFREISLAVAADIVKERGFPLHVHCGLEAGWSVLFLRAGFMSGYDTRSWTAGLGLKWKSYRLDYSFMPLGMGLGESHRLTVGIGF